MRVCWVTGIQAHVSVVLLVVVLVYCRGRNFLTLILQQGWTSSDKFNFAPELTNSRMRVRTWGEMYLLEGPFDRLIVFQKRKKFGGAAYKDTTKSYERTRSADGAVARNF